MKPRLQLIDAELGFRSGFWLGPIGLDCGPGLYHLRGDNGSGKTTLLRALAGEARLRKGHCVLSGDDVWRDPDARRSIGYLPSRPDQPEFLTVDEAWRFQAALRGQPDWNGDRFVNALSIDAYLPLSRASAGQRQKAELICALAADPTLLLLDEPFSHLDDTTVGVVSDWIAAWRGDRIVVIASHEPLPAPADAIWSIEPHTTLVFDGSGDAKADSRQI